MITEDKVGYPADLWAFGVTLYQLITGELPNEELSEFELYEAIKDAKIDLPNSIQGPARELLQGIFKQEAEERIGFAGLQEGESPYSEIKRHPYFDGVDWEQIRSSESPIEL